MSLCPCRYVASVNQALPIRGGCVVTGVLGIIVVLTTDEEDLGLSVDIAVAKRKDK